MLRSKSFQTLVGCRFVLSHVDVPRLRKLRKLASLDCFDLDELFALLSLHASDLSCHLVSGQLRELIFGSLCLDVVEL